jgi:hypothetical protein
MVAATASSKTAPQSYTQRPAGGKAQRQCVINHNDDIFIRTSWADAAVALAQIEKVRDVTSGLQPGVRVPPEIQKKSVKH